jgi:CheY-like chemotaxis protein
MESEEFDVVFTDHGMPEMSGRQLAKALRRRFPSLPIVLLTGDTDAGKADEDVNVVLSKPFMIDDLNATIQELI